MSVLIFSRSDDSFIPCFFIQPFLLSAVAALFGPYKTAFKSISFMKNASNMPACKIIEQNLRFHFVSRAISVEGEPHRRHLVSQFLGITHF